MPSATSKHAVTVRKQTFWDTLDADTLERVVLRAGDVALVILCQGNGRVAKRCRAMLSRDQSALLDARRATLVRSYLDLIPSELFVHIFAQLAHR